MDTEQQAVCTDGEQLIADSKGADATGYATCESEDEWASQLDSQSQPSMDTLQQPTVKPKASKQRKTAKAKVIKSPRPTRAVRTNKKRLREEGCDCEYQQSETVEAIISKVTANVTNNITSNITSILKDWVNETVTELERSLVQHLDGTVKSAVKSAVATEVMRMDKTVDSIAKSVQEQKKQRDSDIATVAVLGQKLARLETTVQESSVQLPVDTNLLAAVDNKIKELEKLVIENKRATNAFSVKYDEKLENLETHGRKLNLIFDGIPHKEGENCVQIVERIIHVNMNLRAMPNTVDIAHRIPNGSPGQHPSIIARFKTVTDKSRILQNRAALNESNIWVRQDLPKSILQRRNYLAKSLNSARKEDKSARLVKDKLLFKNTYYSVKNIGQAGITPTSHMMTNDRQVRFYGYLAPYSNFFTSTLTIDGSRYNSVEQAYQANKARAVDDQDTLDMIMHESNPARIKSYSRRLQVSESGKEDNLAYLERAVHAKFSQNERLRKLLLETNGKSFYECNPYDRVHGTGCRMSDTAMEQGRFTGDNEMGKILERVRTQLLVK